MRHINILVILLFGTCCSAFSQGFDWQWTARLPNNNPSNYLGLNLKYGLQYFEGEISFLEDIVKCPTFNDGSGKSYAGGVNFERWGKHNRFSYRASLQFEYSSMKTSVIDFVPISPSITGEYETSLEISYSKIDLQAGVKYRLFETHFNVGIDLLLTYLIDNSFKATETILGPPEMPPFNTYPPSYSREIISGKIPALSQMRIESLLSIGYDMQLSRGTYMEPNLSVSIPAMSMFSGSNVFNYGVIFGIKFFTAL